MSLRRIHIEKLSHAVGDALPSIGKLRSTMDLVRGKIAEIITQNMESERVLDDEAHKLLDKHRRTAGMEIDEQKAFAMIKKQLAKQKGFIL